LFADSGAGSTLPVALKLPLALQEMVLAVWLIAKEVNSSAVAQAGLIGYELRT
jgi:hypothetical protein